MDDLYVWLRMCKRASRMSPHRFNVWAFMVGTDGTLAERIARGKRALGVLGVQWDLQISHGEEDAE